MKLNFHLSVIQFYNHPSGINRKCMNDIYRKKVMTSEFCEIELAVVTNVEP